VCSRSLTFKERNCRHLYHQPWPGGMQRSSYSGDVGCLCRFNVRHHDVDDVGLCSPIVDETAMSAMMVMPDLISVVMVYPIISPLSKLYYIARLTKPGVLVISTANRTRSRCAIPYEICNLMYSVESKGVKRSSLTKGVSSIYPTTAPWTPLDSGY
jgi:hypothetical protein